MFFRENNFVILFFSFNIVRGKFYNDFNYMEKKIDDIFEIYG